MFLMACSFGVTQYGRDDTDAKDSGDTAGDTAGDDSAGGDTDDSGEGTAEELRLLSLNLQCFKLDSGPYADNDARFATIAANAASAGVEVILAQEACISDAEGDAALRLAEALTEQTSAAWSTAWAFAHVGWEGTADEAEEGVALLVKGTLEDSSAFTYAVQGGLTRVSVSGSYRGVRFTSVHLDYDDADARRAQARQAAMETLVYAPGDYAAVLAGDFNAISTEASITDLFGAGLTQLSAAADDGAAIDHVFAPAAAGFTVVEARRMFDGTLEPAVSDHAGVFVHLARGAPVSMTDTRLVAEVDAGFGHFVALRGDSAPLDWELGWPGVPTADARWEARFSGWSGEVAYKWLLDDTTWEVGEDRVVTAGAESSGVPVF